MVTLNLLDLITLLICFLSLSLNIFLMFKIYELNVQFNELNKLVKTLTDKGNGTFPLYLICLINLVISIFVGLNLVKFMDGLFGEEKSPKKPENESGLTDV